MAKRFFSMTGLAVIVLIVLAACGAPRDDGPQPTVTRIASPINAPVVEPTSPPDEPAAEPTQAEGGDESTDAGAAGDVQKVTVVGHDIYFDPENIEVKAGTVEFTLPNEGAAPHDFSIDALGISVEMPVGETATVTVDIPAGTYEYYCNVPGHKGAGMVGTLVAS